MFFKKNAVTICSDKEYVADVERAIKECDIKIDGVINVHITEDDQAYTSFCTPYSVKKVSKLLTEKLYDTKALIEGHTVIVNEK